MDTIFIQQLEVETVIGVYEWEKSIKQRLIFDLEMQWDSKAAAATDDLEHALDYSLVAKFITDYVTNHHFELIETVANRIAKLLIQEFHIDKLNLSLNNPDAVPNAATVGICIQRSIEDYQ